jgi:ubiquitin-conjugating enzyme E2 D/E
VAKKGSWEDFQNSYLNILESQNDFDTLYMPCQVFHPNISQDGTICVDILGPQWTPALTIENLLLSICSLLPDPNPEDPTSPVCKLYRTNREAYNKKARKWTKMYAIG